jgi:hypothetical protein
MSDAGEEWPTLTPPLCERCWFPIREHESIRRRVRPGSGPIVLVGFEHARETCTPQVATEADAASTTAVDAEHDAAGEITDLDQDDPDQDDPDQDDPGHGAHGQQD